MSQESSPQLCEHCSAAITPKRGTRKRFCNDRCRSAHRRAGGSLATLKSVRLLARGGYSVILHLPHPPNLQPGSKCRLEAE